MQKVSSTMQKEDAKQNSQGLKPYYLSLRIALALDAVVDDGANIEERVDAAANPTARELVGLKSLWESDLERDGKWSSHCEARYY